MAGVSKGTAKLAEENRYAEKKWKEEQHELERRQRKRRETAIAGLAQYGGIPLLKITRHFLKKQGRREKEALLHWQVQQRLQKRLPRFKYRLGKRTPYLADLWRFCKRIAPGAEVRQCKFPRGSTLASPYAAHQKMVRLRTH